MSSSTFVFRANAAAAFLAAAALALTFAAAVRDASATVGSVESEIQPRSYFESVVNTFTRSENAYSSVKFNPDYRTITFPNWYTELEPTFLYQVGGYGLYYLYLSDGTPLGSFMTTMNRYQANYYLY